MTDFSGFGLPESLTRSLKAMGYETPTPIQTQAIPVALEGKDILGSAQTGTGKTAAFGIPLAAYLVNNSKGTALVLTPTRELAVQVMGVLTKLLGQSQVRGALLIGGESMRAQLNALKARPRLIVGTPGRIIDHLSQGTLLLHDAKFLVLDETDRMLDLGFGIQLEKIARYLPQAQARQTLMFSATMPKHILSLAAKYLTSPVRIAVDVVTKPAENIRQEVVHTTEGNKYNDLVKQLDQRQGSIIIFVKTKRGADRLAGRLSKSNHRSDAIHGDLSQRQRDKVIHAFRDQRNRILVATDIAARGLDITHIAHVINYDLPQCPEDYIHRIGRTARAGAEGASLSFLVPEENKKWKAIERMMNPQAASDNGNRSSFNGGRNDGGRSKARPFRPRRRFGRMQAAASAA